MTKPPIKAPEGTVLAGRLACRQEREMYVAYYAQPDTMEDAITLGSIAMAFIADQPERRTQFIAMMKAGIEHALGGHAHWAGEYEASAEELEGKPREHDVHEH
jgi:hypothetical protein